jgi:DNA polymerase-1
MGTITRVATKLGYFVEILSNDKDIYQLVSDDCVVATQKTSKCEMEYITKAEVLESFGCTPKQIPDMKALMGDSSDNIKSIERCFQNIESLDTKSRELLKKHRDRIIINKKITTIQRHIDIGRIDFRPLKINYRGFL